MATIEAVELAAEAEYIEVERALHAARDAVDVLTRRLWPLAIASPDERRGPARLVTSDDVAMLYSFRQSLKLRVSELRHHAYMLGDVLAELESARRRGITAEVDR